MSVYGEQLDATTVELKRLGGYVLGERVGEGGMGVVYKATDAQSRVVAVKLLKPHVAADEEHRRRFAREARVLSRVRGENIAEVLDGDVAAQTPYLVTRYVDGPPLYDVVTGNGPMHGGDLADLAGDLADALCSIHTAGVVHRDLKPGNVLVQDGVAVVIDFGIAQFVDETRWTRTGLVYGTPGYVAPEVLGGGDVTSAADIYAWAAAVAFAALGRTPFGTGPLEAVSYRVMHSDPDLDGCPGWLLPVLQRCLSKDPDGRPTARQLLTWLETGRAPDNGPAGGLAAPIPTPMPVGPPVQVPEQVYDQQAHDEPYQPPAAAGPAPTAVLPGGPAQRPPAPPAQPQQPAERAEPPAQPVPGPPVWTSGHMLLVAALFAVLAGLGAVFPLLAAIGLIGWLVLARTVDRSGRLVESRRARNGPRRNDGAIAATALPWHLIRAALLTLFTLPIAVLGSATVIALGGLLAYVGVLPRRLDVVAGALLFGSGLLAWFGIDGNSVREGSRRIVRRVAPSVGFVVFWAAILLAIAVACLYLMGSQDLITWPFELGDLPSREADALSDWDL